MNVRSRKNVTTNTKESSQSNLVYKASNKLVNQNARKRDKRDKVYVVKP
jgi:hypothetical protein